MVAYMSTPARSDSASRNRLHCFRLRQSLPTLPPISRAMCEPTAGDAEVEPGGGPPQQSASGVCSLCSKDVLAEDFIKPGTGSDVYHKACYNAKRSVERLSVNLSDEDKKNFEHFKKTEPEEFARRVAGMAVNRCRAPKDTSKVWAFLDEIVAIRGNRIRML